MTRPVGETPPLPLKPPLPLELPPRGLPLGGKPPRGPPRALNPLVPRPVAPGDPHPRWAGLLVSCRFWADFRNNKAANEFAVA